MVLEKILNFFRYFVIISPWKRAGTFYWIHMNPLHPRTLCAKFDPVILEKEMKMWKVYDNANDNGQRIRKAHLNLRLRWTKNYDTTCISKTMELWFTMNKRSMGHIAHLKSQFKSMNTLKRSYDHIYYKTDPVVQEKIFKFHVIL